MQPYLIKYGTAVTIPGFKLKAAEAENYQVNPTLATGDVKIEKDGGASTDLNTLPSVAPAGGTSVSITISATEAQCARGVVTFIDASGAEWSDDSLVFMTYGHASAAIKADLSDDVRLGLTALPNVAAGSNGGLPVLDADGEVPSQVASVADNAITASGIATGAITAEKIAADAITANAIADDAITADKFADGAFDAVWSVSARTLTSFGTLVSDIATAVWGAGTRILTAGTNIVLAKGTGVTGFNDPTVAAIRTEMDDNSTKLAAIVADTNELQTDLTNGGRLDVLVDAIKAKTDLLPADIDGLTYALAWKVMLASLLGRTTVSGSTVTFKDRANATIATVTCGTTSGERTASAITGE